MRRPSVLAVAMLSLAIAACSNKTEKTASELAQSAATDTAHNAAKAGDALAGAADAVGAKASDAARDAGSALHEAGRKVDAGIDHETRARAGRASSEAAADQR